MSRINDITNQRLEEILRQVARFGMPLIIAAWILVFFAGVGMFLILRRHSLDRRWLPASIIGLVSLAAHMLDFFGTLRVSPDLSFEANPIWCIVVQKMGLGLARWYGFTGKLMLAILSFEFFAYYLVRREKLWPEASAGFIDFWRNFGRTPGKKNAISWPNIVLFFSFLFSLIGPFCFYIALLNSITDYNTYQRLPAMPIMLAIYLIILCLAFLLDNYWSFKAAGKETRDHL